VNRAVSWVVERVVTRAGHVDPEACRRVAERLRAEEAPVKRGAAVADRVSAHYARRAALHGSAAGLPLGPLAWLAGYLDAENMARTKLELPATLAYLADPSFFERADWRDLVERWAEGEHVHLSPGTTTALSRMARRIVRRFVTRRLRRRYLGVAGRLVLPWTSASLLALWNYLEVQLIARPALARYRDQVQPSVASSVARPPLYAVPGN
jgi:hypothetical protein